jgi:hypothetical protein
MELDTYIWALFVVRVDGLQDLQWRPKEGKQLETGWVVEEGLDVFVYSNNKVRRCIREYSREHPMIFLNSLYPLILSRYRVNVP